MDQFPMLSCSSLLGSMKDLEGTDVISGCFRKGQAWPELVTHGWRIIMMQKLQILSCKSHAIFERALGLMGQTHESETALLSANGQVIYLSILERGTLYGSAYLRLRHTRGCLIWEDQLWVRLCRENITHQPSDQGLLLLQQTGAAECCIFASSRLYKLRDEAY